MPHDLPIRGVMFDLARVTERHEYYRALPERLARWGYNTLFAHFTDDEGCVMKFRRRPELATPHAMSVDQMKSWIALAAEHGITVVPEIESFGHTTYIHGRRKYRHLVDTLSGRGFNALNPLHRDSRSVLRDLVEESAEVFADSPWLHAGLDEVNFGGSEQVRRALKRKEAWQIFAEHVAFIHETVTRTGKRMIMWGDHLLHEPRIADAIPDDIIIADWHYNERVSPDTVKFFLDRGFDVIGCPASNRSGDMIMPRGNTQVNLQRFARIAHTLAGRRGRGKGNVLGLMNTVWCPMRMLCGIEQFAVAAGGAWFVDPDADPRIAVEAFLRDQYGLRHTGPLAEELLRLSGIVPDRNVLKRLMDSNPEPELKLTSFECDEAMRLAEVAVQAKTIVHNASGDVTANADEFANYELAADLLIWAARVGLTVGNGILGGRAKLAGEGRKLIARVEADWKRGRYADDPIFKAPRPTRWRDALLPNLRLAVERLGGEPKKKSAGKKKAAKK